MEQDGTRWLNAIITEAGNRISSWILRTIEMIRRELAQKQNLQQTPCTAPVCQHLNIDSNDGLDECLDCGARNY